MEVKKVEMEGANDFMDVPEWSVSAVATAWTACHGAELEASWHHAVEIFGVWRVHVTFDRGTALAAAISPI